MVNCKFLYYVLLLGRFHAFSSLSAIKMNSTEVQNPRHKDNRVENLGASSMKDVMLIMCSVLFLPACAKSAHVLEKLSYRFC